jgi:uncharacterized repeat protein (TIGR03803 family)
MNCALSKIIPLWLAYSAAVWGGTETVLHNFASPLNGANPYSAVIRDAAGNLYGTTQYGGTANAGVVYKVDTAGSETVLYNFTGGADGGGPDAGVILDAAGNVYGPTQIGGKRATGVVFKVAAQ